MRGITLLLRIASKYPDLQTPGRTDDVEYFIIDPQDIFNIHRRFERWARWHRLFRYKKDVNDCDDLAKEFVRYVVRYYRDKGAEQVPAVCVVYTAAHAYVGIVQDDGVFMCFDPRSCKMFSGVELIEMGRI